MTTEYDADVIVVGSGVIGTNAAHSMAKAGKSVILLEAGDWIPRWKILENFRASPRKNNYNDPYPSFPWAMSSFDRDYIENTGDFEYVPHLLKLVGGTTWHWAAATWRVLPEDMKMKSLYGVGFDWPMEYEDLEPYFHIGEHNMGVAGSDTDDQSGEGRAAYPPRSEPYPVPPEAETYMFQRLKARIAPEGYPFVHEPNARTNKPWDGRPACSGNNNCMPVCPIGAMYSGDMHAKHCVEAGVKIISRATVYRLEKGEAGKIAAVHYRTPEGDDLRLTAKAFMIAANGIETPKLLLLSDVANSSDMVGRHLMDHSGISLNFLSDEPIWPGRGQVQQGAIMKWRSGDFRAEHGAIKHAPHNNVANPIVTPMLLKRGLVGPELDEQIRHWSSRWVTIESMFEVLPHATNRVTLHGTKKDALGIPTLSFHYNLENDPYVLKARDVALSDYDVFVRAMNGTERTVSGWQNHAHVSGTVMMGADAATSVCDHEARSWDHDNLFLATTGTMPTGSVVNPTLTGLAIALRTADAIIREV